MCIKQLAQAILLTTLVTLLSACGETENSAFAQSPGGSDGVISSSLWDSDTRAETADLHRGVAAYDDGPTPILNMAFPILDADEQPIDFLDGGDFEILEGAASQDPESSHKASRLVFNGSDGSVTPAQPRVIGQVIFLLDTSSSMATSFTELKTAAQSFVSQIDALDIPITLYTFNNQDPFAVAPTALGSTAGADPAGVTTLNTAIDGLTAEDFGPTEFLCNVSFWAPVPSAANYITYDHTTPATPPEAGVILLVVMSDGDDNSFTTRPECTAGEIETRKYLRTSIITIAVGEDPTSTLDTISEFAYSAPEGGTYSDVVDLAAEGIENFYNGFYLVEFRPGEKSGNNPTTFNITLVGNSAQKSITYDNSLILAWLNANSPGEECCEFRVEPSVDLTNTINLPAGETLTFTAEELWGNHVPNNLITWTVTGGLSTTTSGEMSRTLTVTSGSGTVQATDGAWTSPLVTISQ